MDQVQGSFKLVYRGTDGYDLVFLRLDGLAESRVVPSLAAAIDVVQRILRRPLTPGESETLAIGNGLVASISLDNFNAYF